MTNRRAFTLVELMVVVGIMGLLGTISVGGYRAMRRGMEEKGTMQNVNFFIRAAYQRAQIDRQPTAIFFWNETLRASTADDNEIVVGKAVAVRRSGRFTAIVGQYLYDEFADLEKSYPEDGSTASSSSENSIYLYPLDNLNRLESSGNLLRSTVEGRVYRQTPGITFLAGTSNKNAKDDSITLPVYAFKVIDQGGVTWEPGMAYGFEFANIELPRGYIFESSYSTSLSSPVKEAGTMTFGVGANSGNGMSVGAGMGSRTSIGIYALRPGASGSLEAKHVGDSADPSRSL